FAAETVCFLGFNGYLRQPDTVLGRSALRVLHRALEGLRYGVPAGGVAEGRLGELVEALWDARPGEGGPLSGAIYLEAVRLWQRAAHAGARLGGEMAEQEAFDWQVSRLAALEPVLTEYLEEAAGPLGALVSRTPPAQQKDLLLALNDLRADAAEA